MPGTALQISYSLSDIKSAANQLWQYAHQYRIWTFSGGMGAGKTTLISVLCQLAGVTDMVSSPTFALINEYDAPADTLYKTIYHMDWYRLGHVAEAIQAGIEDSMAQPGVRCFIEWPEQAPELLQSMQHVQVSLSLPADSRQERIITAIIIQAESKNEGQL